MILISDMIEVSSVNKPHENKEALIDDSFETYWHVKHPPETNQHWVLIDLGAPKKVEALAVMSRVGHPEQSWDGDHAIIDGSNDFQEWIGIAWLPIEKSQLDKENPDWTYFIFQNPAKYRWYRIVITDKFFFSIAELELYERAEEGS